MARRGWGGGRYDDFPGDRWGWAPRPNAAARAKKAAREVAALGKKGITTSPVVIEGRTIARTFWGKAWCENLESYSDYANRLPRGRTYVRTGSVVDLRIDAGRVDARVQGSSLYEVTVSVGAVEPARWKGIASACAGKIDSVIELLSGKLSTSVMEVITDRAAGLFPSPKHMTFSCSCPDWASMCKHVAATLYGVGARLDREPELLFRLRGVGAEELVATAAKGGSLGAGVAKEKRLGEDLGSLFGIDIDTGPAEPVGVKATPPARSADKAGPAKPKAIAAKPKVAARSRGVAAPAAAKPQERTLITGEELAYYGFAPSTVQSWLRAGALIRTSQRGVYEETDLSRARVEQRARGR